MYSKPIYFRLSLCLVLGLLAACSKSVVELPYNQGTFTNQHLSAGSITDGLDVSKIEYQHQQHFERFIFHISHGQGTSEALAGTSANNLGHYKLG